MGSQRFLEIVTSRMLDDFLIPSLKNSRLDKVPYNWKWLVSGLPGRRSIRSPNWNESLFFLRLVCFRMAYLKRAAQMKCLPIHQPPAHFCRSNKNPQKYTCSRRLFVLYLMVSWFSAFSEFIFSNSVIRMDALCTFSVWTNAHLPNRWLNMFFNCRSRLFGSKAKSAVEVGPGSRAFPPVRYPPQRVVIVSESYPKCPGI